MDGQDTHYWIRIEDEDESLIDSIDSVHSSLIEVRTLFDGLKSENFKDYNPRILEVGSKISYEGDEYSITAIALRINAAGPDFTEFHTILTVRKI